MSFVESEREREIEKKVSYVLYVRSTPRKSGNKAVRNTVLPFQPPSTSLQRYCQSFFVFFFSFTSLSFYLFLLFFLASRRVVTANTPPRLDSEILGDVPLLDKLSIYFLPSIALQYICIYTYIDP